VTTLKDIRTFIPINKVVRQAALDMYADFEKVQAQYTAWAIRGIKKLTKETLKSPPRYALLTVNKNLNNAVLPCDFKEELGVFLINSCGQKVPLVVNGNILPTTSLIEDLGCEVECEEKCGCYPKQLCNDIQTTQVINKITIGEAQYDETVTSTLMPNGEYYIVTTTPIFNMVEDEVEYVTKKEYVTSFDLASCGCIKNTERNFAKLESCCYDAWCCHCSPCVNSTAEVGGYRIFEENGTISFDTSMPGDKVLLVYRGFLPKQGNEYLVPEIAFETLIEYTKHKSIANKKGIAQWEKRDQFDAYMRERGNMNKSRTRLNISDIIHSALNVPQFVYNTSACGGNGGYVPYCPSTSPSNTVLTNVQYVDLGSSSPPLPQYPTIITFEGSEATGGVVYNNPILAPAIGMRVFANPINRFLTASEFNILPTGGVDLSPLGTVYGVGDFFDVFGRWV
jgi:hypothetical protein